MKLKLFTAAAALISLLSFQSCSDDDSLIGSSLAKNEVTIIVDSVATKLKAESKTYDYIDSRSTTKLLGKINVPEYGSLKASFVSRLLPATSMDVPDSITVADVDSMKLFFRIPRGSFTGDSLAPQKLAVYRLTRQLPSDINNTFDPTGYYDTTPIGEKSFCTSALSETDSAYLNAQFIYVPVTLPKEMAIESFKAYREKPEIFAWPSDFAKVFPGIYVEQTFGSGCLSNISNFITFTYYHHYEVRQAYEDGELVNNNVLVKDSVALFTSAPEVLSSNNIEYRISDNVKQLVAQGKHVITTPGGYYTNFIFPAKELLERYNSTDRNMAIISDLTFQIPADAVKNDYGIGVAPNLLMIKESEIESFFAENKVPDKKTSFWAAYNSSNGRYDFSSMREYLMDLIEKGEAPSEEEMRFTLIPVTLLKESMTNQWTGTVSTYVLKCMPYIDKPTMTILDTDNAIVSFTYSEQVIN